MRVLEPMDLELRRNRRAKKQKAKHIRHSGIILILLIAAIYSSFSLLMPVALPSAGAAQLPLPKATKLELPWPGYGQAAIGAVGYGLLAQNGEEKPLPMASTNKILTALAVLQKHPLPAGQTGPTITLTEADVAIYTQNLAEGQSVIPVFAGEEISQYQALQALLLPSANNMADVLARWAYGSNEEYLKFANTYAKKLGLTNTTIADASGFSPLTRSTARDLTLLAEAAINEPIVAEIAAQTHADLPVAGRVFNVNALLGRDGIIGIKTGNTDEAGGCYVFAARRSIDGAHSVVIIGAIMGAPNLERALVDSLPLLNASFAGFGPATLVHAGQVLGTISQPKGPSIPVFADKDITALIWKDKATTSEITFKSLGAKVTAGQEVGSLNVRSANKQYQVPLRAKDATVDITPKWRLRHAAGYI